MAFARLKSEFDPPLVHQIFKRDNMSKGSRSRPLSVPTKQFDNNWEAIFGKKSEPKEQKPVDNKTNKQ